LRAAVANSHFLTLSPNGPFSQRLPAMISVTGKAVVVRPLLGAG
jgi:hypothetical protein